MSDKKGENKTIDKLTRKFKLVAMNDSFEEMRSFRVSRLNIISLITLFGIIVAIITYCLIAFTGLKHTIADYPKESDKDKAIQNDQKYQALKLEFENYKQYYNNIITITNDGIPGDSILPTEENFNSVNPDSVEFSRSIEDSLLRTEIDSDLAGNYETTIGLGDNTLKDIFFFTPLNGSISQSYDLKSGHLGVDIVGPEKAAIKSTLDGTVLFATWTSDAGHVIQVQHPGNLISIYKHNSVILKKVGDKIKAGEAIAIIGNSGKLSTGNHLHFELWQNGKPLDPQQYIIFNN